MEIDGILVEFFVVCAAEIARLFVELRFFLLKLLLLTFLVVLELRLIKLLLLLLILGLLRLLLVLSSAYGSLGSAFCAAPGSPSPRASRVDIRFNNWLLVAGGSSLSNILSTSIRLS